MDKITTHESNNLKDVDFGKTQDLVKHALASPVQEQVLKPKKDSEGFTKHDSSLSKIIRLYKEICPKPQKQGADRQKGRCSLSWRGRSSCEWLSKVRVTVNHKRGSKPGRGAGLVARHQREGAARGPQTCHTAQQPSGH
jgi:hypothetical protein